jgi:hypothetical protein
MFGIPLFDLAWLVVTLLAAGAITGLLDSRSWYFADLRRMSATVR